MQPGRASRASRRGSDNYPRHSFRFQVPSAARFKKSFGQELSVYNIFSPRTQPTHKHTMAGKNMSSRLLNMKVRRPAPVLCLTKLTRTTVHATRIRLDTHDAHHPRRHQTLQARKD
jgi:hypothetical protein